MWGKILIEGGLHRRSHNIPLIFEQKTLNYFTSSLPIITIPFLVGSTKFKGTHPFHPPTLTLPITETDGKYFTDTLHSGFSVELQWPNVVQDLCALSTLFF